MSLYRTWSILFLSSKSLEKSVLEISMWPLQAVSVADIYATHTRLTRFDKLFQVAELSFAPEFPFLLSLKTIQFTLW